MLFLRSLKKSLKVIAHAFTSVHFYFSLISLSISASACTANSSFSFWSSIFGLCMYSLNVSISLISVEQAGNTKWLHFKHSFSVILWLYFYHGLKCFKLLGATGFGRPICNHVFCQNISNNNFFRVNLFSDPIVLYLNVFCTSIKLRICCEQDDSFIISSQANRLTKKSIFEDDRKLSNLQDLFLTSVIAIYSALIEEKAIVICCFDW